MNGGVSSVPTYPLSALVAQDDLKLCLMLVVVQPRLGGVLIRGDKGAAKSTAARGLAALLPEREGRAAPFINLPLGATEDRVVGALDLEYALRGKRRLQAGLLGQADGGVLYIDEVNLLADHLVDVLLDAAVTGVNRVEREGLAVEQASRFALIGSMNPEEGRLRPQFLDRFGLCVNVHAPRDTKVRADIVRRRMQFECDAETFIAQYAKAQNALKERLRRAQSHLSHVELPDIMLTTIAERCQAADVSSLRADLVLARGAVAYAALCGAKEVSAEHVERVAPFVFTHRQMGGAARPPAPPPPQRPPKQPPLTPSPGPSGDEEDARASTPETKTSPSRPSQTEQTFRIGASSSMAIPTVNLASAQRGRRPASADASHGRITRSIKTATPQHLAVGDSVHHAVTRTALETEAFSLTADDLHGYQKKSNGRARVLLAVDSSGSLAARQRMANVKGVVAKMLEEAHERRDEVSLIAFRGVRAECVIPWTRDTERALAALEALPTGGRTPLAHALELANSLIDTETSLVLFTDGKSNVPLQAGSDPWQDVLSAATRLRGVQAVIVDTEEGYVKLQKVRVLAEAMAATWISLRASDG